MSGNPIAPVERALRRLWSGFGAATIPVVLGTATIVFGLAAWTDYVLHGPYDAARHPELNSKTLLHAVAFILFRTLGAFFPSVWNINEGTVWTDITAGLGLATFYSSVVILAADRFAGTLRRIAARFFYRDHVVVIGGTALARRAGQMWARRRTVVHIIGREETPPPEGKRWVKSALDSSIVERFGLARATHVFIDLGEDMATLALALELLPAAPAGRHAPAPLAGDWTVVVGDKALADQFADRLATLRTAGMWVPHVNYFCPQRVVVRDILAEHPLFLDGRTAGTGAIHAVIVGFGSTGNHLVEAIFLTSLVGGRPKPRVTVLSSDRVAARTRFLGGRPSILDELDVEFLDLAALDDFEGAGGSAARLLRARDAAVPTTAVFLMSDSFNENVRLAVKLNAVRRRTGRLTGALFALESSHEPGSACRMSRAFAQTLDGFIAFGLKDERLETQICDPDSRDRLARGLHSNYLRTIGETHPTWDELSEGYRRANTNAADHALAKLHVLGFDVSGLPAGTIPGLHAEDVAAMRAALQATTIGGSGPMFDLMRLEHDRWSVERRLDGWTYGERKDAARQTHPFLLDWDALCARHPTEVLKDKGQIEALIDCLVDHGDLRSPLRRRAEAPPCSRE